MSNGEVYTVRMRQSEDLVGIYETFDEAHDRAWWYSEARQANTFIECPGGNIEVIVYRNPFGGNV